MALLFGKKIVTLQDFLNGQRNLSRYNYILGRYGREEAELVSEFHMLG